VLIICIGEEVVFFDGILFFFSPNAFDIFRWCGISDGHIELFRPFIDLLDELVVIFKLHSGIGVCEVFPDGMHEVVCSECASLTFEVLHQLLNFLLQIVERRGRVFNYWLIIDHGVKIKARRRTVVTVHDVRKHKCILLILVLVGLPYCLQTAIIYSLCLILIVYSANKKRVKSHFAEKGGSR